MPPTVLLSLPVSVLAQPARLRPDPAKAGVSNPLMLASKMSTPARASGSRISPSSAGVSASRAR